MVLLGWDLPAVVGKMSKGNDGATRHSPLTTNRPVLEVRPMTTIKKCAKCGEVKPVAEFHRQAKRADGYARWCKPCTSEHRKDYYASNEEYRQKACRRAGAAYHADIEAGREKRREYARSAHGKSVKQGLERTPKARERQKAYRASNHNLVLERTQRWRAEGGAKNKREVTEKRCRACNVVKAADLFTPHKDSKDGLCSWCKRCVADKIWARSQRLEVRARLREWGRSPEARARQRQYSQTPHGKAMKAARTAKRRAILRGIVCTLTGVAWGEILAEHGYACCYCRRSFCESLKPTMDHKIPVAKGGHHVKENVVPACARCNSSKGAREWPATMPDGTQFVPPTRSIESFQPAE